MKKIMSVVKYTLAVVIAISLAWIAFFKGDGNATGDRITPTISLDAPTTTPETGSVTNDIVVSGNIAMRPAIPARATISGTLHKYHVDKGEQVGKDQKIATIKIVEEPEPPAAPAEGEEPAAPPAPKVTYKTIKAPSSGTIESIDLLAGQDVGIGTNVASVSERALYLSASLNQEQRFRLTNLPPTAEVTVEGGPAPFQCPNLRIGDVALSEDEARKQGGGSSEPSYGPYGEYRDSGGSQGGGQGLGQLICEIPESTKLFPGITAEVKVIAGEANNVMTLPVSAVRGRVGNGKVWVVNPETREQQETDVTLGLTDGKVIEVRTGLAADSLVLLYAPGERPEEGEEGGYMEYGG